MGVIFMLKPGQPAYTQPKSKIDQAIEQGMKWADGAVFNAAQRMLPPMPHDKQATIWHSIKSDPFALQSYIIHLGNKTGITDPAGLDQLAGEYIQAQSTKFGG